MGLNSATAGAQQDLNSASAGAPRVTGMSCEVLLGYTDGGASAASTLPPLVFIV